jgi:hypothetical protein
VPDESPLAEAVEKLRLERKVPLGVLAFDVENECLVLFLFRDMRDMEEANALLAKIGIRMWPSQ